MSQTKQILLVFLIPFGLSVGLASFKNYYYTHGCVSSLEIPGKEICEQISIVEMICILLIIGLFFSSLILPPFMTWRTHQKKRNALKMKAIIE
jgi:hypothetical protein